MATRHKLLFICSGNYYRSRFAELLFNELASQSGLDWTADSRGIFTQVVRGLGPLSRYVVEGLAARGIQVNGRARFPLQLQEDDLAQADLIVAMKEGEHRAFLEENFPFWAEKIEYWRIHDVDVASVSETLGCIEHELKALIQRLSGR